MDYNIANIPVDLILNILNVIIFVVVVRLLVYKPVKNFIESRKAKINSDLDEAAKARAEAEALRGTYESKLAESDNDIQKTLSDARTEATKEADKIISDANNDAERIIADAKIKAENDKEKILSSVRDDIIETSSLMAEKLLGHTVTDSDTKKIAEDFFSSHGTEIK